MGILQTAGIGVALAIGGIVAGTASAQDAAPQKPVAEAPRAADERHVAAVRRDLEALVRRIEYGPQWDDDSPTALVTRLVSADEAVLRAVCREAWANGAQRDDDHDVGDGAHLRWTLDLLFGARTRAPWRPAGADDRFLGADGAVRVLPFSMSTCVRTQPGPIPTFDEIVRDRRPVCVPTPDRAAILAALAPGRATVPEAGDGGGDWLSRRVAKLPAWCDRCAAPTGAPWATRRHLAAHDEDVAMFAGELCASDPAALRRVIERASAKGASVHLFTALGWSRSPAAVPVIERELAAAVGSEDDAHTLRSYFLLRALHRADPAACRAFVGGLPASAQDRAVRACHGDVREPVVFGWLRTAPRDAASQAAVLRRVAGVAVSMARWDGRAAGRLLDACEAARRGSDDAGVRAAADAVEAAVLTLRPRRLLSSSRHVSVVPQYPSVSTWTAALREAAAAGRLVWTDAIPSLWDTDRRIARGPMGAKARRAADWSPLDWIADDPVYWARSQDVAIEVTGDVVDGALRLHLRNAGPAPLTLNPLALRLATMHRDEIRRKDGATTRGLNIVFGDLPVPAAVPAAALIVIPAGEAHHWTLPLLAEDCTADHIAISIRDRCRMSGVPAGQPIVNLKPTIVK